MIRRRDAENAEKEKIGTRMNTDKNQHEQTRTSQTQRRRERRAIRSLSAFSASLR